jgi:hypothetical protein
MRYSVFYLTQLIYLKYKYIFHIILPVILYSYITFNVIPVGIMTICIISLSTDQIPLSIVSADSIPQQPIWLLTLILM